MRIHLDPTPVDGGGQPSTPVPNIQPTNPVAEVKTPEPAPMPMVQLTPEQYQRLVESDREVAKQRTESEQKLREAEQKAAVALGEKDGVQAALNKREDDFGRERSTYLQDIKETRAESAINSAMAGFDAADAVALEQVKMILAPRVVVEKDVSGKWIALDTVTRRPAADVLREELAGAAFARFRKAQHQGGSGGGKGPAPTNPNSNPEPVDVTARRIAMFKPLVEAGGGNVNGRSMAFPKGRPSNN